MTLWTDDATLSESGRPTYVGKENIRCMSFEPFLDKYYIKIIPHGETKLEVSDNMAYLYWTMTSTISPKDGSSIKRWETQELDILKRQEDGSWKFYIVSLTFYPILRKDSINSE